MEYFERKYVDGPRRFFRPAELEGCGWPETVVLHNLAIKSSLAAELINANQALSPDTDPLILITPKQIEEERLKISAAAVF